jgi:hydrogenase maturation protein HypF
VNIIRKEIKINGIVQGVGFRPFIYGLANRYSLKGFVINNTEGVVVEVEGDEEKITEFIKTIQKESPPIAKIEKIKTSILPVVGYEKFNIRSSDEKERKFTFISPDISICDDCLTELFTPIDRRYRYPFINCTNCGPRFTIIKKIPYDRKNTTMEEFKMCSLCASEYNDPVNRRFHAQPNACEKCGPKVKLVGKRMNLVGEEAIKKTIEYLRKGKIVAIKGLGGYHLACKVNEEKVVKELRKRKKRITKPFALMVRDLTVAKKLCYISKEEEKILLSSKRPIVLLRKKQNQLIAKEVAPIEKCYGIMLPYTPLHYLLLEKIPILVMTSGNLTEQPIVYKDEEALTKLSHIADYFLMHNRKIYIQCDDSVVRWTLGKELVLRRSRGYIPFLIELSISTHFHILGCGGELKNTFCFYKNGYAIMSHYIGDLENLETLEAFENGVKHFKQLFDINPQVVVYDLHPEYLSTKYAKQLENVEKIPTQHHHSHIVSCMIDNKIQEKVIGVVFDGLGYGVDNTLWGGEFLVADMYGMERKAYFDYVGMPGGERVIKEIWRMGIAYLWKVYGKEIEKIGLEIIKKKNWKNIVKLIKHKINTPYISSVGRLFDGVSSLIGIAEEASYEAEGAIKLEMCIKGETDKKYDWEIKRERGKYVIKEEKLIKNIVEDIKKRTPTSVIAQKFHNTIIDIIVKLVKLISKDTNLTKVVLTGGVFQNIYLLENTVKKLTSLNFKVYTHKEVPPNDSGISLGQIGIGIARKGGVCV